MQLFYGVILLGLVVLNISNNTSFDEVCKRITTPEKIEIWAKHYLQYESDKKIFGIDHYWQSYEEMFRLRMGDCEDFATIISEILSRNKYENWIMVFGNAKRSHAICVFRYPDSDTWMFFSNYKLYETNTTQLKNIPYYYEGDLEPMWSEIYYQNENNIIETFEY